MARASYSPSERSSRRACISPIPGLATGFAGPVRHRSPKKTNCGLQQDICHTCIHRPWSGHWSGGMVASGALKGEIMIVGLPVRKVTWKVFIAAGVLLASAITTSAQTTKKPNILFIMGDDVGWYNIGAYHQGIMSGKTPNLDKLAAQGMRFTDYYAEASCTAGRANFITGEIPLRTGLTTVGQAGADVGIPAQAC